MSTILKALRRLEEEKTRGGAQRPLREEVASGPGEQPSRRWTSLLPVLALLIGAGVGASAWWLWPYGPSLGGDAAVAAAAPGGLEPVAAAPDLADPKRTPPPVALQPTMPSVPQRSRARAGASASKRRRVRGIRAAGGRFRVGRRSGGAPAADARIEPATEPSGGRSAGPIRCPLRRRIRRSSPRACASPRRRGAAEAERAAKAKAAGPSRRACACADRRPPPAVLVSEPADPSLHSKRRPRRGVPSRARACRGGRAPNSEIYVTRTQWLGARAAVQPSSATTAQNRRRARRRRRVGYEVSEIKPSGGCSPATGAHRSEDRKPPTSDR